MDEIAVKNFIVNEYIGCAPDMGEHDLDDAAFFLADRLYDKFGGGPNYRKIAMETLKPYFPEEE